MKKFAAIAVATVLGFMGNQAIANEFNLPGPYNVVAGTSTVINLNDAVNSAGLTGTFNSFSVTADWVAGGGNPWSSEAEITMNWSGGSVNIDPPTSGAGTNGDPTSLTFEGVFGGDYDPGTDGTLDLLLDQSFAGSDATWSNIVVCLEDVVVNPPSTVGSITDQGFVCSPYDGAAQDVQWVEFIHGGGAVNLTTDGSDFDTEIGLYDSDGNLIANDDDGGPGLLSRLEFGDLAAGTYYIASGGFNTTFGAGLFSVSSNSTAVGTLKINAIPEPTSLAICGLVGLGMLVRRRR